MRATSMESTTWSCITDKTAFKTVDDLVDQENVNL